MPTRHSQTGVLQDDPVQHGGEGAGDLASEQSRGFPQQKGSTTWPHPTESKKRVQANARLYECPGVIGRNSCSKGHSPNASHDKGDRVVGCLGISAMKRHEVPMHVTAPRNPESTLRKERRWHREVRCHQSPLPDVCRRQSSVTTGHALEGWVTEMSFPLGTVNSQERTVLQNEPEATTTRHHECTNSLGCLL